MNATEIAAKLAAYRDALEIVAHHMRLCTDAPSLEMDVTETLRQRVAALEAQAATLEPDKPGKRGRNG